MKVRPELLTILHEWQARNGITPGTPLPRPVPYVGSRSRQVAGSTPTVKFGAVVTDASGVCPKCGAERGTR